MTALAHRLDFGGEVVNFSIERTSRRKTVAISVGYDGVRVLAPSDLDDDRVMKIVRQRGPGYCANRPVIASSVVRRLFASS